MPGLIGVVGPQSNEEIGKLLENMAKSLKHEDWYKIDLHREDGIGLGRVSLGILNAEPQPIWNEDRTLCIVMEGEVYDYEDEKRRLMERGHRFQVDNDVEFVLHLFEELGSKAPLRLNGAFVAAVWDLQNRRLTIFNDRLGLRPIYYARHNGCLTFAAGVRGLLADPGLSRRVDPIAIAQFLSFDHVIGNRTLLSNVLLLPPASLLTFSKDRLTIQPYWTLEFADVCRPRKEEEYLEGLIHHLKQAIVRQTRDDLPAGVSLSGGLDSRTIVALLNLVRGSKPLHTFTYGISDCDDARLAREVASLVGAHHHFFKLKPDYLSKVAEEGVRLTDGLKSCVHMHPLAALQAQRQHVKVLYIGYLGDPLMGSHLYRELWTDHDQETLNKLMFENNNILFNATEQKSLFTEDFQLQIDGVVFDSLTTALANFKTTLVANLHNRFDLDQRQRRRSLMGHELVRSQVIDRTPFCDSDLVDFMLTVPPGLRLDRFLFINAFSRIFPDLAKVPWEGTGLPLITCARDLRIRISDQIRWRLRAAGLKRVPVRMHRPYADYDGWMRGALRPWVEKTLLNKRALERGYFEPEYIRNFVAEHVAGANHSRKLGVLLALELWHQQFID